MREQEWPGRPTRTPPPLANGTPVSLETLLLHEIRFELRTLPDRIVRSLKESEQPKPQRSLKQYTDFLLTLTWLMLLLAAVAVWIWDPAFFRELLLAWARK